MFKVPVLLILYNRVEETHDVFQVLRTVQPTQLYVAGDAPKVDSVFDRMRTYQTRAVIQPEWPCQLHTLWQTAIKWFFEQEDEGIILFEDTVPGYDFFPFCEQLLEKYRNDKRIYSIGGFYWRHRSRKRYKKRMKKGESSYFFSAYASTWGFATWKNRWTDFSLSMDQYDREGFEKMIEPYMKQKKQRIYWINRFNALKKYNATYWDYQYNFHVWAHQALCITPYLNLVTNVGFRKQPKRKIRKMKREAYPIMPLVHPDEIRQDYSEDRYMFKHIFSSAFLTLFKEWLNNLVADKKYE